jgi:hypothetical protein
MFLLDTQAREVWVFVSLVKFKVGNSRNMLFWRDRWLYGSAIKS